MDFQEAIKQLTAVRDGLKQAIDSVCGPEFRQMDTAAVLISEVSVAEHELGKVLDLMAILQDGQQA